MLSTFTAKMAVIHCVNVIQNEGILALIAESRPPISKTRLAEKTVPYFTVACAFHQARPGRAVPVPEATHVPAETSCPREAGFLLSPFRFAILVALPPLVRSASNATLGRFLPQPLSRRRESW
jgi:hypothetical protein